jgi:PAS domain S-box-containing protein
MNEVPRNREGPSPLPLLFDAVADGIFISNPVTGRFVEINQPGCRMFGYTKSELVDRGAFEWCLPVHTGNGKRAD